MDTSVVSSENSQEDNKSAELLKLFWARWDSPLERVRPKSALPDREGENSRAGRSLV